MNLVQCLEILDLSVKDAINGPCRYTDGISEIDHHIGWHTHEMKTMDVEKRNTLVTVICSENEKSMPCLS